MRNKRSMRLMNVVSLLSLFCSSLAHGADRVGLDILGLAKQDIALVAKEWPQGYVIGALEGTFGSVIPHLETVLKTGRAPAFRVHLVNWTCRRNKNCDPGEPHPDHYLKVLAERGRSFQQLADRSPQECYLSPLLEYDETDTKVIQSWIDTLKRVAPKCRVVLSPFRGAVVRGVLIERHGNEAKADIISNDGESLFDANSAFYPSQAKRIAFGWIPRFNCRVTGEKTFTSPMKRAASHCLTAEDIRQAARVLRPEPQKPKAAPPACRTSRELRGKELWKTNAEDYASGDVRGNRPLLISGSRTPSIDILSPAGKRIGCLRYFGPFEQSGLYRHYSGSCEGDSGVRLMDEATGEWLYLKDGHNCLLVNAIRRKGYYR